MLIHTEVLSTRQTANRIVRGFLLLAVVFVTAVCGYHFLHGENWMDAVWLVVVTVSTVGYSEESRKPPDFQLFTLLVIVFGLTASAYAFTGFIQFLLAGEIERIVGKRRMQREISKLNNHVIICGFGRLGQNVAADLVVEHRPFAIIESDVQQAELAEAEQYLVINGDATEEEFLLSAGLQRAAALVTALPTDAANVFITLTARNLNADVQILARAELPSTEGKLRQAGASKVVMPAITGAKQMVRMITRPSTADLFELMAERSYLDLEMDELPIPPSSELVGQSVRSAEGLRKHQLLVVAIKPEEHEMLFNPGAEYVFRANDVAIMMGKRHDIDAFCQLYRLRA